MHRTVKLGKRRGSWTTSVGGALLGLLLATPAPLWADESETVEIPEEWLQPLSFLESGILYNSEESYRYSDYTGLREEQVYYMGDLDLWRRAPWNDETPWYWRLRGSNLGLTSRRTRVDAGLQGVVGLRLYFDQLPKNRVNDGGVFYGGDSSLVLPPGWVPATTPAGMTTLTTSLRDPKVKHERRRAGAALMLNFTPDWTIEFRADRDAKDGSKLAGVMVGNNGGNPRSALVNEPIDYQTNKFDVFLRNAAERGQMEFGFHYSAFDNKDDRLAWQVSYLDPGGWDPAADFAAGAVASKGQAPDNDAYQATFAGGYDLPLAATRLTLNAAYGRMEQDQTLQPYTINPGLLLTPTPLPRTSLEGEIETTFLSLGFVSRPLPRLSLHGRYRVDDRDNHTDRDTWVYVSGDSAQQGSSPADSRVNLPYSYRSDQFELGTDYNLGRRTNLGLDYEFERIERDYSEVEHTRESRLEAHLNSRPAKRVQLRLKGGYASRTGSSYDGSEPFLEGHTPAYIASLPANARFENHPETRRYYLADRVHTELTGQLNYLASDELTLGLSAAYAYDDYDRSRVGLTDNQNTNGTIDLNYDPIEQLHSYLFYTYELVKYDQNGWSFTNVGQITDPTFRWNQKIRDDIHTVGAGARTSLLDGQLELGLDYLFTYSSTGIDYGAGPSVTGFGSAGLPDSTTKLHNFQISADYHLNERTTLRLGYLFEKFDWEDWALEGVGVQSLNQVITLGSGTPDYRASLFLFSLRYELP